MVQSVVDLVNNTESYLNNLNAVMLWATDRFGLDQSELEPLFLSYKDLLGKATAMLSTALPQVLILVWQWAMDWLQP